MFYFLPRPTLAYCRTPFFKSTRQPWRPTRPGARWQQYFRAAPPQPGDEQVGERPQAQLTDGQSIPRLLRAFKRGKESREAAVATYDSISRN